MKYSALIKRPAIFQRLTGHTVEEFEFILDKFKSAYYENYISVRVHREDRERKYGAGRPSDIRTLEDKLMFILIYVRIYPLLFMHGLMFGIAESSAHYWVHALMPILNKALGYAFVKPSRRGRNLEKILKEFPELRELGVLVDGTERPKRKPKDKTKRKTQYSGKKKRHTIKNVLLTNPTSKKVLYLSDTVDGSVHDKTCIESEDLRCTPLLGKSIPIGADLGFEGLTIPGASIKLPHKKPKREELTSSQKLQNKAFSKIRVSVENAIGGVKRARCVSDVYRNTKEDFEDLLMVVSCGLHNVRVKYRYAII